MSYDSDILDYRVGAGQKWQMQKVQKLKDKLQQLELKKDDDPYLCENMTKACEEEDMLWVCESNETYSKKCSSNSRGVEEMKKRGGTTEGAPPRSFKRR